MSEDRMPKPVNEQWTDHEVEPKDREQQLQQQLGPQYAPGRDKGAKLEPDTLGPNMDDEVNRQS